MAGQDIALKWEQIRRISSASITGTYAAIGTPLVNAARAILICNNTNQTVTLSIDGTNDYIDFVAGAVFMFDVASDRQLTSEVWQPALTQFYAKGTAGTGNFCITTFY
jgi:hypothetical protein